jgi:deoxycytidylate deaminase
LLPSVPYPEIFFGICAPVGVDTKKVHTLLSEALKKYSYEAEYFKVTALMKAAKPKGVDLVDSPLENRYDSYIRYANKLREVFGLNYTLAMLCCVAVKNFRRQKNKGKDDPESPIQKQAYVFDQFKRKEELDLLRQVYGRLFIVVSVYSEQKTRLEYLVNRIASDHSDARLADTHKHAASELMQRDQAEQGEPHGQGLEDAFPTADLFVDVDDQASAELLIRRFLDAYFGSNAISPTHDEYGMYLARTTGLRSVDLSRQVGATLYCTTFPCHMCAKHIVASGVKRVVYIEPYPKSYAEQLHGDAIIVARSNDKEKVVFEPFIGISPFRYRDLFARDRRRKDDSGSFKPWIDDGPEPIVKFTVPTYVSNERAVIKLFNQTAQEKLASGQLELMRFDATAASNPSTGAKPRE